MTKIPTPYVKLATLWPKLYKLECCYCTGKASKGGVLIEGEYAHKKCHEEACK